MLAFVPTRSDMFSTILRFLPLLAFYFYCQVLRFSVGEWLSDASPIGDIEVDARDREDQMLSQACTMKGIAQGEPSCPGRA